MGTKFFIEDKTDKVFSPNENGSNKGREFRFNELKIKEVEGTTFMKAPFIYEGTTPVIEIVGEVRLYKNWFDGRKSYSVGIKADDHGPSGPGVSGPHDAFDFKA